MKQKKMERKENLALPVWSLCIIAVIMAAMMTITPVGAEREQPELMVEYIDRPELVKEYINRPELVKEYIDKPVYINLPNWMSYPYINFNRASEFKVRYIHQPTHIDRPIYMEYPYISRRTYMTYPWVHLPNGTGPRLMEN